MGTVRFLQDVGLDATAAYVHHASPLIVFVERLEIIKSDSKNSTIITPVVLLRIGDTTSEVQLDDNFGYTYVQCAANSMSDLDAAVFWIERYAGKHNANIITNFDELSPVLSDAPLSYQKLVRKTYDRTYIENLYFHGSKFAERIDRLEQNMAVSVTLGDGTVVHGDLVVANSIQESFNRARQSSADDQLKTLIETLSSRVGALVGKLDSDAAKDTAEALDTLTKEIARPKPRRDWWEVSLKTIAQAAELAKNVGNPVIETVSALASLLSSQS